MIVYRSIDTLAKDLGFSPKTLYAVSYQPDRHYKQTLLSCGGKTRLLSVPDPLLKSMQRSIYRNLLCHMPVSPYAAAYRFGTGIAQHARLHSGQKLVYQMDIQNFFDHILYSAVKDKAFPETIYSAPLRILLTMLCYYHDRLPQGAPTSPVIANLVLKDFDEKVGSWCRQRHIRYSRYCDDLAFSGDFDPVPLYVFITDALSQEGFFLNPKKTRLLSQSRRQMVTGLVVNRQVSVPSAYRRQVKQEIYYCQKYGISAHMSRRNITGTPEHYLRSLLGRLDFILYYHQDASWAADGRQWLLAQLKQNNEIFH